jgi:hypothetical protein
MVAANSKTHKDMSVSRVPLVLVKKIEHDAKREHLSESDVMRRALLRHYGLLPEENGR